MAEGMHAALGVGKNYVKKYYVIKKNHTFKVYLGNCMPQL